MAKTRKKKPTLTEQILKGKNVQKIDAHFVCPICGSDKPKFLDHVKIIFDRNPEVYFSSKWGDTFRKEAPGKDDLKYMYSFCRSDCSCREISCEHNRNQWFENVEVRLCFGCPHDKDIPPHFFEQVLSYKDKTFYDFCKVNPSSWE